MRWCVVLTSFILAAAALAVVVARVSQPSPSQRAPEPPALSGPATSAGLNASKLVEQVSQVDPGQRFYLYVPPSYDGTSEFRLLVVIHGFARHVTDYAGQFVALADDRHAIILAPYFPLPERFQALGIGEDRIRADLRLLDLVQEVGARYRVDTGTFDLFGFSAGGQFTQRFMYAHPERVRSAVAAAPGTVALPTDRYRWPSGVGGLEQLARIRFDLTAVRQVRAMLIVGDQDLGSENLNESNDANRFGSTRLERARTLHQSWLETGIDHTYVEVPGVAHVLDDRIAEPARRFLAGS
jgi:poly(3-hydroxybutyrate) depolymerase